MLGDPGHSPTEQLPSTVAFSALGLPDRFARRVARNQQLILLEESNLYRDADPAAGSGGIEALTAELTKHAWALVQEIERGGGIAAAIGQGLIQKAVAVTRAARLAAVAKRRDPLTGVSDYPNLSEAPVKVLDVPRAAAPAQQATSFEPLPSLRLAAPFEALRDASDAILKKTGTRPKVFLANLGRLSDFTARAMFAKNFYEAGGIETIGNDGFLSSPRVAAGSGDESATLTTDIAALITAYKASGAALACLCSSDKVYAVETADAAQALNGAGAVVHLAGRPGEHEAGWNDAGVKAYIYVGCDVLATLTAAHDIVSKP